MNWKNSGFVGVALLTVLSLAGCGGSTKPPSVSVNASATALDGSNAVTLTATVTNDKTTSGVAQGVTWSLVGSGTLSNTTTSAATYTAPAPASAPVTVTITATSIANTAKSSSITLTIHAALAVTTTNSQLAGIVGTAYSVQLSTSDGIPPYNWSLASGSSLPSCLTMTTAGVISGALTPACVGSYSITFNVSDSGSPNAMSASETLTLVILQTPTLTFAAIPTHTYGDAPFTVSATSASIGAVTYSVTSGPATISGNMVTITGAGTVVLGASQAANGNFTAATASTSFTVNPETPVLNFAAIPTHAYGDAPFTVSATSASSGAVTYSVTSGPATIAGNTVTLTGAGTVVLKASQAAVGNYAAATATTSFSANPGTAALTFAAIPTHTYGDAPFTVSATSASSGAVTYSVNSGPATISGSTVTITGIGTVEVGASQAATTNYVAGTASISFVVNPEVPTLTFAAIAARTFGDAPFTVSATSASSGAVTYSVTSGQATISGNMVTITGAGTVVLGASQAADGNYAAATASTSFTVNPEVPSLVFAAIGTQIFGEPPFTVSATSASNGTVTYSVTSGPATISGNTVTLTGAGTVVLGASQAAAGNYAAATATISFTVNPETLTLTFAAIPAHNYGDAPFTVSASSLSTGVVTYSVVSGPATISGSTVTITGVGTVQLQANQAATANYAASTATTSFTVNPGTPTLTFAAIPAHTYGDAPFTVSASSASNGAVTYSVNSGPATISGSTVTITGAGTVVLGASQVATANYNAATASISFAVNPEVPTLTFAAIPAHTFGDAPFTVSATSASSGAVTYSVTSGPATIAGNTVSLTGAGTVVLKAMQAASGNYAATTATTSIVVNPETPTLVFAAIPTHTYGDAPFTVSATSASSGAVTYSVTSGPATIAGNTVTITGVGTVVLGASQAASGNYGTATASTSFAVNPETPNLVFAAIPTHTFGDAPFTVNATSASSGAVTYSVTSGPATIAGNTVTLTGAGIVVLGASQAASGNYGTATASTSFTVNPETPTLVFAAIPTHTFGDAPFTVSATSVSSGAVTYSVTSGPATISGNTVTLTGPGTVVLGASQAASGNYASSTASISFSVNPAVSITTGTTLPPGVVGGAYSLQLSATGGSGGYNWSVTSGYSLPGWMSLSVSGGNTYLMGTPLAAASAVTFNLTVTDSTSHSANATFSVTVTNQLTITTTSLPVAYTGSPFPATSITAAGGTGTGYSFTWAAAGGSSIPPGLSLATSGAITGSPSAIGAYSVAITVKDSSNATAQRTLSVTIYAPLSLPAPNPASLPSTGTVGASYNGAITATGGSGSYSWTLTGLQLTMTSSSNGATLTIGGIPNAATTVTLNVKVTDTATNANVSQSYNIVVTNPAPLTLPVPNPVTLGSATSGQSYSGTIVASGGVGPNYTWTVNGLGFSQPGLYITLGDGLSATTNDNNVLTITGTPTSPTSQGNPISFTVAITDSASPANSTGPLTYTIVVNSAGSPVSGQIMPANICGNPTLPIFNVSINTNPVQTVQTDSNGNYSFAVVPNGTYTITPSISAAGLSSLFYPATQANIQVNNNVSGVNFSVSLGYTVSGNVSYSGSQSGRVYLELNNNNCGGNRQGTSIASSTISTNNGAFSIRGVSPGNYTLNAWLDPASLNFGTQNAVDPVATVSNLSISNASLTNKAVPLVDPGAVTLSTAPTVQSVNPIGLNSTTTGRAVMISYRPITNGNNDELATSYTVEWSVNSDCSSPAGTKIFPASGDSSNVFLLNTANVTGMTAGNTYYFCVRGNAGASSSGWTLPVGPVIITAPSSGFTVSGSVTIPSSVTPSGPLYVGLYDQNSNAVYGTVIASPSNSAPNTYSIKVPAGSNYFLFTILDQNNDGLIDASDISNTNGNNANPVVVSGNLSGQNVNLTSFAVPSTASVATQYWQDTYQGGTGSGYNLSFDVRAGDKLPVAVTLSSGPNVLNPVDMGACGSNCGNPDFQYSASVGGNLPNVGDTYTFNIIYSDGTTGTVTGHVTGWNGTGTLVGASDLATLVSPTGIDVGGTPSFTWTYPANAGSYNYRFSICCGNNGDIWDIPGNNSKSNGFTSSQIPSGVLVWGTDPTDGTNTPSQPSLSAGNNYTWSIETQDNSGNQAQAQMNFETTPAALSLQAGGALTSATVGQPYNGAINASGGQGPNYTFTVNGSTVTSGNEASLGNGLFAAYGSGGSLSIVGAPTTATAQGNPISFTVSVTDNASATVGPNTYTIVINAAAALSLPPSATSPALVNTPFTQSLQASGGISPYFWTVNSVAIPVDGTATLIGDGISVSNTGSNTLQFSGTPTTINNLTLNVAITDSASTTATQTYHINVVNQPNGANNSHLSGTYVCLTQGFNDNDGSRWASISSFVANGGGSFTGGVFDQNSRLNSSATSGTSTGTYSIGADDNGLSSTSWTLTSGGTGSGTKNWAISLTDATTPAQQFRMVEIDDVGSSASGQHSTANCNLATTSAFTAGTINGSSFVFGVGGENESGSPKMNLGRFSTSTLAVTAGVVDTARGGNTSPSSTVFTGGSYTAPDPTTGRATLTLTVSGGSITFAYYIIDANRAFLLETSAGDGLQAGNVRKQQQGSYSGANLSGAFVLYMQGYDFDSPGSSTVSGYYSSVFQGTGSGSGNMTINQSYQDDNGTYKVGDANGGPIAVTFDSSNPGRSSFVPGAGTGYLYFFNNNQAMEMDIDSNGAMESGWMEAQSGTFTPAGVAGTYMLGQMPSLGVNMDSGVGQITSTSSGTVSGTSTDAGEGDFNYLQPFSGTFAFDGTAPGTGTYIVSANGQPQLSCAVISSSKAVCINQTSSSPSVLILQK